MATLTVRQYALAAFASFVTLAALLFFVVPSAHAATPPVPGSADCDNQVAAQVQVVAAQNKLNVAAGVLATDQSNGAPPAVITTDQATVDNLTAQLKVLKKTTADQICTGTATTTPTSTPAPVLFAHCSDFASQAAAQAFLVAHPGVRGLDGNGNGIACENAADGSGKVVTGVTTQTVVPVPGGSTVIPVPGTPSSGSSSTGTTPQVGTVPNTSAGVNTGGYSW